VNSGNWASFFEFRVFDGTYSLATGKNMASAGNDGNINSYWSAADGLAGHSWVVDLGSNLAITGSQVVWLNSGIAYQYKIESSTDSINWVLASDKTAGNSILQTQSDNFNVTARYVRITITGGISNSNKAGFSEFRLFDGSFTTITPVSVIINCIKPECIDCLNDSIQIKPLVNVNNTGWQPSGAALLCRGGNVSFSTSSQNLVGWSWNGPNGYRDSTKQIDLLNIQPKDTGTYKATLKNIYFNFHLKLIKDSVSPFIKINNKSFNPVNSATVLTGDTVILSPVPLDSVGWTWSWTGPAGFSAKSRTVKIAINDTIQTGSYISYGIDGFGCGSVSQNFMLIVKKGNVIPGNNDADSIKIYPNPSHTGMFNVKNCDDCNVSVYTIMGALIYDKTGNNGKHVIDLSGRPGGVYLIRLLSDKIHSFKKVIIQ
jgi:F5/8 type C domain/Secretion system C-terminal sorting domain